MAEQIAVAIRQAIAERKLPPGCRLVEMKIAREMGTSRGPLREALFQLEREGLVVRKPNRGTFVVSLTEELIRQIASLRGVLEGFAATLALKRLTEEEIQKRSGSQGSKREGVSLNRNDRLESIRSTELSMRL